MAEEERLAKEKQKIVAKQQAMDAIIQMSSMITSAALAIKSGTDKGGWVGAIVAIAAFAGVVSSFIAMKSKIKAASSYFDGTPWLDDPNAPHGRDTIPIMAHRGERIIPTKDNERHWNTLEGLRTGNREQLAKGLAETVKRYKLEDMADLFAPGVAMPSLDFEAPARIQKEVDEVRDMREQLAHDPMLRALMGGVDAKLGELVAGERARVDRIVMPDGTIIEYSNGGKRKIKNTARA